MMHSCVKVLFLLCVTVYHLPLHVSSLQTTRVTYIYINRQYCKRKVRQLKTNRQKGSLLLGTMNIQDYKRFSFFFFLLFHVVCIDIQGFVLGIFKLTKNTLKMCLKCVFKVSGLFQQKNPSRFQNFPVFPQFPEFSGCPFLKFREPCSENFGIDVPSSYSIVTFLEIFIYHNNVRLLERSSKSWFPENPVSREIWLRQISVFRKIIFSESGNWVRFLDSVTRIEEENLRHKIVNCISISKPFSFKLKSKQNGKK